MTDKEAIEMAIRTLVHIKDSSNTPHIIAACSIAISALQEREERQWINVKDRPPDVNKTKSGYEHVYVIATNGRVVRPMIYERACVRTKAVYRWKWCWDRIYDDNDITHWMPLPEPPKEEK